MHRTVRITAALMIAGTTTALVGCASTIKTDLPSGADAYATLESAPQVTDYRIAPFDVVNVTVFLEPDLSRDALRVNDTGEIALPLIGNVIAAGRTTEELAQDITARIRTYLTDPRVTVALAESSNTRVTIEGAIVEPGVYPISGRTGLLDLVAVAKGPTPTAKLDQAIILRRIDGQQFGAVFDLEAVRSGMVPDPQLRGGDQVVIGLSGVRENWRSILQAAPLANLIRLF